MWSIKHYILVRMEKTSETGLYWWPTTINVQPVLPYQPTTVRLQGQMSHFNQRAIYGTTYWPIYCMCSSSVHQVNVIRFTFIKCKLHVLQIISLTTESCENAALHTGSLTLVKKCQVCVKDTNNETVIVWDGGTQPFLQCLLTALHHRLHDMTPHKLTTTGYSKSICWWVT